jgi:hypothetical protein
MISLCAGVVAARSGCEAMCDSRATGNRVTLRVTPDRQGPAPSVARETVHRSLESPAADEVGVGDIEFVALLGDVD